MLTRSQAFEQFRRNLSLSDLQDETVATRQRKVRQAVARQLAVIDDFLTGSYRRQTLIAPLTKADIDIVVVLDDNYRGRHARAVLELTRQALLATYPRTPRISRNGQAVTVSFSDFLVDVVPAFRRPWWNSSGLEPTWDICDSGGDKWIETNPRKHVELSALANGLHDGRLVPCIKQLKAWNQAVNSPLRSFHLEVLAWSIFGSSWWSHLNMQSDWQNTCYFFDKARDRLRYELSDPAGTGGKVSAYLTETSRAAAISKVGTAYDRCLRAEAAAAEGDFAKMHEIYRRIFGSYYP